MFPFNADIIHTVLVVMMSMGEWSLMCHDTSKLPENTIFFVVLPLNKIHDVIVCNEHDMM